MCSLSGPWGISRLHNPARPHQGLPGLPQPCHGPGLQHSPARGSQPLSQWRRSSAGLQPWPSPPCLATGPIWAGLHLWADVPAWPRLSPSPQRCLRLPPLQGVPVGQAQLQGPALPATALTGPGLFSDRLPQESRVNCSHWEETEIRLLQDDKYPMCWLTPLLLLLLLFIFKDITHRVLIFGMWLKLVTGMRVMLLLLRVLLGEKKKERKENNRLINYLHFFTNTLFTETSC